MSTTPRTDRDPTDEEIAATCSPTARRIDELEREIDRWRDSNNRLRAELRKVVIELAELRKDKARLDWLNEHEASIEVSEPDPLTCRVQASDDFELAGYSNPYNVRAAIDAAIAQRGANG